MSTQHVASEALDSDDDLFSWGPNDPEMELEPGMEFSTNAFHDGPNGSYDHPSLYGETGGSLALLQAAIASSESALPSTNWTFPQETSDHNWMQNYLVDGVYYFREKDQTSVTGNESEVYHEDDEEPRATSRSDASPSYESLGALDDSSDMSFESWPMVQQETESVTSDAEYPSAATDANYIDLDETSSSSSNDLETRSRQDCVARYLGTMSRLEQPDERLTGDDIEALQKILFARAQNTSSIPRQSFLAHPLWLRLGRTLPATLPQAASTASYIFTVMHHKHPEHWTLGQLDLPQRTFHHYDSLDLPGIQDQVRDEIVPWLENIADMKVGVGEMRGPRQDDAVSCGIHVLHVLSCLLENRPVPDHVDIGAFRYDMLRLVLQECKATFPHEKLVLEFERTWNLDG